ncbi:MAG: glucokinase [Gammaproteobacteria bacterium]|nr:glucokinase [Gammaproteobacteria bacterium]
MASPCHLVGDIGGTNARFAIVDGSDSQFSSQKSLRCADFETATLAMKAYLESVGIERVTAICLAVAGPVGIDGVRVTNNTWRVDIAKLREVFNTEAIRLLNDFEAIAYAIPLLGASDFFAIGSPHRIDLDRPEFTVAVVGPGTGFGAAGLCKRNHSLFPIVGEQGHVGFAPETEAQFQIYSELVEQFGRVSTERLLSGPGVKNIYRVLSTACGNDKSELSTSEIFSSAAEQSDPSAVDTVNIFFEVLGQVAGDLALALGAAEGIYIAGGIVPRYAEMLAASNFRRGFENKGRQRALMEKIPVQLVIHPQPGLLGASYCAGELT